MAGLSDGAVQGGVSNQEGLDCTLMVGGAMRLPLKDRSVEAAVSDPPTGGRP